MMYGVEYVIGFKMDIWRVLSNLVDYGKSICSYERLIGLVIQKSDVMEVFLSVNAKRSIKYCARLIME